jgi:hypothetical protein
MEGTLESDDRKETDRRPKISRQGLHKDDDPIHP